MKLFAVFAAASALLASGAFAQQPTAPVANTAPVLCAVKGEVIDDVARAAGKSDYKGRTYYFCCPGCVAAFNKADDAGKAKFSRLTELRTERVVLGRKVETLNREIAALEGKPAPVSGAKSPEAKPAVAVAVKAPKMVYCAVTGEEIGTPDKAAATIKYNNKEYYLCCPGCQVKWDKDPAKFAAEADKRK